jgi:hypothetical protein
LYRLGKGSLINGIGVTRGFPQMTPILWLVFAERLSSMFLRDRPAKRVI